MKKTGIDYDIEIKFKNQKIDMNKFADFIVNKIIENMELVRGILNEIRDSEEL
jgi:hypothetical protein